MTHPYRLGLKPPTPGAIKLRLATYCDFTKLPTPPAAFGHYGLVSTWGMLENDQYGCCAISGAIHQEMLWTAEGGNPAPFDNAVTLANYSAIAGFSLNNPQGQPYDPNNNPTDTGTAMSDLADHWMANGIVDSSGKYHKVAAVVDLNPGDLRELWTATWLFQSVGIGWNLPAVAITQTQANQPWDVVADDGGIQGGHYTPCVGCTNPNGLIVTWGALQAFTPAFYQKYSDQGICALSEDMMVKAKSIDGFDDILLRSDLKHLDRV